MRYVAPHHSFRMYKAGIVPVISNVIVLENHHQHFVKIYDEHTIIVIPDEQPSTTAEHFNRAPTDSW